MNDLRQWQINDIIELLGYTDRNSWELCKVNSYILALVNSKNKINKDSFMSFNWDEKQEEVHDYEISNEEILRLKLLTQKFGNEK